MGSVTTRIVLATMLAVFLVGQAQRPAQAASTQAASTRAASTRAGSGRAQWARACYGQDGDRHCLTQLTLSYATFLGVAQRLTMILHQAAGCVTLHVEFSEPIAVSLPVSLDIDGATPQIFYREADLFRLAQAVDHRELLVAGPPELVRFARETREQGAGTRIDLVTRFARVKDRDGLGMACPTTEALLPKLRAGHEVTLTFNAESHGAARIYDWPELSGRRVSLPLDGLAAALDGPP